MAVDQTINGVRIYRDSAGNVREYPVEQFSTGASNASADLDTNGNPVPTYKPHAYTYDASGNLATDTVTDGTSTWIRTYTTAPTGVTGDSGWVKQ